MTRSEHQVEPDALLIMGGGGHAAVVAESARLAGLSIVGHLDEAPGGSRALEALGIPHRGSIGDLTRVLATLGPAVVCHAAIGQANLRERWLASCPNECIATIIHPSAVVSPSAQVGQGAFIGPLAVVNARASIGIGAIINSSAIVEHDVIVGAYTHVAPGAVLAGGAVIGTASLIGANATVLPNISIGDHATAGAGSVVIQNVARHETVVGVPARPISTPVS